MKIKRFFALLIVVVVLAGLLSACGQYKFADINRFRIYDEQSTKITTATDAYSTSAVKSLLDRFYFAKCDQQAYDNAIKDKTAAYVVVDVVFEFGTTCFEAYSNGVCIAKTTFYDARQSDFYISKANTDAYKALKEFCKAVCV